MPLDEPQNLRPHRPAARRVARVAATALLAVGCLLAFPGIALAHAGGLTTAQSEPRVVGIEPAVAGLSVTSVEFGARLRMDNRTNSTVVVEPAAGSIVSLPTAAPGATVYWADPRVVAAARQPRPETGVAGWEVPLQVDGRRAVVRGEQIWPEPPAAGLWWLLTLAAALVGALPGLLGGARRAGLVGLAVVTLAVVAAHIVHVAGSAAVIEDQPYVLVFLGAAGFGLAAWPIGATGAVACLRGSPTGPLLCCVTGGLLALVVASTDVLTFHDAVVPYAWGATLDRLLVALVVGGGIGAATAGLIVLRRTVPA